MGPILFILSDPIPFLLHLISFRFILQFSLSCFIFNCYLFCTPNFGCTHCTNTFTFICFLLLSLEFTNQIHLYSLHLIFVHKMSKFPFNLLFSSFKEKKIARIKTHHLFFFPFFHFQEKKCKLAQHTSISNGVYCNFSCTHRNVTIIIALKTIFHRWKCVYMCVCVLHYRTLNKYVCKRRKKNSWIKKPPEEWDSHQITTEQKVSHILINRCRLQLDSIFMVMADKSKMCVHQFWDVRFFLLLSRCVCVWVRENLHSSLISFKFLKNAFCFLYCFSEFFLWGGCSIQYSPRVCIYVWRSSHISTVVDRKFQSISIL